MSVNAIAKQMAMSGPALYRYFASRDELITELIRDAYQDLAETFRRAAASEIMSTCSTPARHWKRQRLSTNTSRSTANG